MLSEIKSAVDEIKAEFAAANGELRKDVEGMRAEQKVLAQGLDGVRKAVKAAHRDAYAAGRYRGAFASEEQAKAFGHFVYASILGRGGSRDWLEREGFECKDMTGGSDPAGGYLVPERLAGAVLDLVSSSYGVFRRDARIVPGTPDYVPTLEGDVTVYAVGEAGPVSPSDLTLSQVALAYKKWATLTFLSSELEEDAVVAVGDLVARSIARAVGKKEDACGFVGDGTPTYFDITGVQSALGSAGAVETQSTDLSALAYDDLMELVGRLPESYHDSAAFYGSASIWALCRRVKDANGNQAVGDLEGSGGLAGRPTLLGYPFRIASALPQEAAVTAGEAFLLFGSLQDAALIAEKRQLQLARSEHVKFDYDLVALRATQRKAIKVYNAGTSEVAGAVVGLVLKGSSS